jgi:hypothetical protein
LLQVEMYAARAGVEARGLDEARVASSHRTPMHSALERCGRLVTPDGIDAVVPVLTNLIRRGAQLGRRACTCSPCVTVH